MSYPTALLPPDLLKTFCQRWQMRELALFGSALREDFTAESDIALLVTFEEGARWSLLDHIQMEQELEEYLQRNVDLITKRAVERSSNRFRRDNILTSAQVVFSI